MMVHSNKNLGKSGVDWGTVAIFALLMVLGWLNIYSVVSDHSAEAGAGFDMSSRYGSQLIWMGVCLVAAVVIMLVDDIYYHVAAYPLYVFMIVVLIATLFIGTTVKSSQSWIRIGSFTVQPAEFAKVATALALARLMSAYNFTLTNWKNILMAFGIILLPMCIVYLQNDTGTALVFSSFLIVLYREGLNPWFFMALIMVVAVAIFSFIMTPTALLIAIILVCTILEGVMNGRWKEKVQYLAVVALSSLVLFVLLNLMFARPVGYYVALLIASMLSLGLVALYAYRNRLKNVIICGAIFVGSVVFANTVDYIFDNVLKTHQQQRVLVVLGIENDPYGVKYNGIQSTIAIGSGGFTGKGFLKGTQTQYDFVPEQSTDFIFSTLGEEWGFLGATFVLGLFCWLIIRIIKMGERMQEPFGKIYCYGVASVLLFHIIVNVGMTLTLLPVIGIPLPLFSYGGSSLLAFTILFFIAVKLDSSRQQSSGALGYGRK